MPTQKEIGDKAEAIAVQYLAKSGYRILATKWYFGHYELDIVAREKDVLVIVEVKARTGLRYEHPSEAISNKKIKRIVEAGEAFILEHDLNFETRFDVITIIFFKEGRYELEHFKDAFYPTM